MFGRFVHIPRKLGCPSCPKRVIGNPQLPRRILNSHIASLHQVQVLPSPFPPVCKGTPRGIPRYGAAFLFASSARWPVRVIAPSRSRARRRARTGLSTRQWGVRGGTAPARPPAGDPRSVAPKGRLAPPMQEPLALASHCTKESAYGPGDTESVAVVPVPGRQPVAVRRTEGPRFDEP